MSNVIPQSVDDAVSTQAQVLPTSINIPMIKGEMLQLRPSRLEDLDVLESIDAFFGASTITGRKSDAERSIVDSWVRDSVAWSLGDVDVEATLYAHGMTRTIAWTMMTKPAPGDEEEPRVIGMIFLTQVDAWSHSARIQVVLGRDFRGRGYSRDAMPRVMTYGFAAAPTGLNLHRIWVSVPEKNTRSLSVYQSLGFTIEGTMRHALWDEENEKYQDQVIMGTLVDEYDPVRALDAFGMRMNPENPGVKEALASHEHSIEIVREHHDGTMEIRTDVPAKVEAIQPKQPEATADPAPSKATAQGQDAVHPEEVQAAQWPYPEQTDTNGESSSASKRAWWRRLGRSRDRNANEQ